MPSVAALIALSMFLPCLGSAQAGSARFTSTGAVHGTTATGGWSSTPDKCRVDATPADPSKLFTLIFINSPGLQAKRLDWPASIAVTKQGRAYTAHIKNDDGTTEELSAGSCKLLQVEVTSSLSGSGAAQGEMNGSLKLDCTEKAIHITSDLHFTGCH